jgi:hypothetical protein
MTDLEKIKNLEWELTKAKSNMESIERSHKSDLKYFKFVIDGVSYFQHDIEKLIKESKLKSIPVNPREYIEVEKYRIVKDENRKLTISLGSAKSDLRAQITKSKVGRKKAKKVPAFDTHGLELVSSNSKLYKTPDKFEITLKSGKIVLLSDIAKGRRLSALIKQVGIFANDTKKGKTQIAVAVRTEKRDTRIKSSFHAYFIRFIHSCSIDSDCLYHEGLGRFNLGVDVFNQVENKHLERKRKDKNK